jgi:hypothetical protein
MTAFAEKISAFFKGSRYRERLLLAVLMIGILTWDRYSKWRSSFKWPPDEYELIALICYAALFGVLFCDRKGRPFWFLLGVAFSMVLLNLLLKLHAVQVP